MADPGAGQTQDIHHSGEGVDFANLVRSLGLGIAVVEPKTWRVLFENAKFFKWFPPTPGEGDVETLLERIEDFPADRAAQRLEGKRPMSFEVEVSAGARTIPLRIEVSGTGDDNQTVLVQCTDASKEKETQYMLDSYSKIAEKNARDLEREKERVERLLLNIMPKAIMEEMKDLGTTTPQRYDACTILMLDFVGFTDMAVSQDPSTLLSELNDIFSAFDRISETFGCERIKTIGDAYMAVSGLPEANPEHAHNIARVALRMRKYLERRNAAHPQQWLARIGINTGPVIGSLVGISKYVYDLLGPGVNLAARMEAMSETMQITLSEDTYQLLKDDFDFTERGDFEVKGFGTQHLYFLDNELARPF